LGHRCENFISFREFRNLIDWTSTAPSFDDGELVINIRGAEVLGDRHTDYGPIPFSFYDRIIEQSQKQPVFVGQIGDDEYSQAIRHRYPKARIVPSRGAVVDFFTIAAAKHLVPSVSAFSWIAAWVSSAATIHLPVLGMLNPRQRPDVNFLPIDDDRYSFYEFPVRKWSASAADFEWLDQRNEFPQLSVFDVRAIRKEAENAIAQLRSATATNLARAARREWLVERLGLDHLPFVR
jgi:hypothetical protein